jgi:hypothetical protein
LADQARAEPLPEVATVSWRPLVDADRLRRRGNLWTVTTVAHVLPFILAGGLLVALQPLALPVALACIAHAWVIPELYAARGANVVRRRARGAHRRAPERRALGLLGDLVGHDARDAYVATGLVPEQGRLGMWLVGPAGALLVRRGRLRRGRVDCWCVRVRDPDLPDADRVSHLLLALRADERGFATVANLAFSGAPWRVRRRLEERQRPALTDAVHAERHRPPVDAQAPDLRPAGDGLLAGVDPSSLPWPP